MSYDSQRWAVAHALRSQESEDVLQMLLQMKSPVRVASLFVLDRTKKTATLKPHNKLVAAAMQALDQNPNTSNTVRMYTYWFSMLAAAVYTVFAIQKNKKEVYEQASLVKVALTMRAKLVTMDIKKLLFGSASTSSRVMLVNRASLATAPFDFLESKLTAGVFDMGDALMESGARKELEWWLSNADELQQEHWRDNKAALQPTALGMLTMVLLTILNKLAKAVLRPTDYAKYLRQMARPTSVDGLARHRGQYDGCLESVDDHYHELFQHVPETVTPEQLRYILLTSMGDRRVLQLHHLVRADGSLRAFVNEHAHAIAAPVSWTMSLSDLTHRFKRRWTRKRTGGSTGGSTRSARSKTRQRRGRSVRRNANSV